MSSPSPDRNALEAAIIARGKEFFASIAGEAPSVFNKAWWTGKVMDWSMRDEDFKVQMFRFVDVLPTLNTSESLGRHIEEYFAAHGKDLPAVLRWGIKGASGRSGLTARMAARTIRTNIEGLARQFIVGQNAKEALKSVRKLRKDGFAFTVDILGEAAVSRGEALQYQQAYLDLLDTLAKEQARWDYLGDASGEGDWGHSPKVNISIKPTCLYSQVRPMDFEGSVVAICERLRPILHRAREANAFVRLDVEQYAYKDITLAVFRRLRSDGQLRDYPHFGIVLQSYLRDTDRDLEEMLAWAREESLPISIRLVKGAYWDYETVLAKQSGHPVPVYTVKAESDAAFERHARQILENHDLCHLACGSHNIRSISAVMEWARALGVPEQRYEFQVLYGMAGPVRKGLRNVADRVRLYCPYGQLLPGMAYLVRRLLENTANESFLRQSFAEAADIARLLADPAQQLSDSEAAADAAPTEAMATINQTTRGRFQNDPFVDFTQAEVRAAFPEAIARVRQQLGKPYPLVIGGEEVITEDTLTSVNPARPTEVIGTICQAGIEQVDQAIEVAKQAFGPWRDTDPAERAAYLRKAAELARQRVYDLSAWQVLEVGKQWDQAHGDVCEAIDFLDYYAQELERLAARRRMGRAPGELNHYFYQPKGLVAVIAPWNFPLAISCGMAAAAVVAGNCVIYKPAGVSSVVGYTLAELFREAGLPPGVFNYLPGRGRVMGDHLVDHPDISAIAFTGSMEVGLRIIERASKVHPGQANVKKVIAEMGGKNAIIIDDDADLDEAIHGVIYSAFGFQGQKCSACSRVIVLEPAYERFVKRLAEAAESIGIGPSEDPANYMGPVVDGSAQQKILEYIEIGKQEGRLLVSREVPDAGYYVPLTIIADIEKQHRLAQEEIFGPVLAVMKAKTFDEAIDLANSTAFALTGGVYSRSPQHLEQARREFRVGNLYLNRGCTGALVERHPFGGFKMSGVGTKAGGPDYLLHFMDPRAISENTMRRGFAPVEEDDEWI